MRLIAAFLAAGILALLFAGNCFSACISGELANFDVHNFTDSPVNDFTLTLQGIKCGDIEEYFCPEWYDSIRCWEDALGTHIKWFFPPLAPSSSMHFGVRLRPGVHAPIVTFAALTWDCQPVASIPFPWQAWEGSVECPIWDIISGNPTIPLEGVYVFRQAAFSPVEIPLNNMTVDDPMITGLDWFYMDTSPQLLLPDEELELEMQTTGAPSAVVMYYVDIPDSVRYLIFISQALLSYGGSDAEQSTWGGIKALYR
ncbi:MAG: hypothetical protein ACUVUU_03815 [bacterium]